MRQMSAPPIMIGRVERRGCREMKADGSPFPCLPNPNLLPQNNTESSRAPSFRDLLLNFHPERMQQQQQQSVGDLDWGRGFQDLLLNFHPERMQQQQQQSVGDLDWGRGTESFQDLLRIESERFLQQFVAGERPGGDQRLSNRQLDSPRAQNQGVDSSKNQGGGVDLNRTPPQNQPMTRRRKYTPKVIREGKPARRTPRKTATPSSAEKRRCVREKKDESPVQENPTSAPEKISDDADSTRRKKPVRRSLNFDSADSQAAGDQLSGLRKETVVVCSQEQDSVALESSIGRGVGFEKLDSSMNGNLRAPQTPSQPPRPSRQEMLRMKWQADFGRMVEKMNSSQQQPIRREGENLKKLARMINCRNNQERHHPQDRNSEVLFQVGNGNYNGINRGNGNCSVNCTNPCPPDIHKRRRVENGHQEAAPSASSSGWKTIHAMQTSRQAFSFADAQRSMALEKMQSSKYILASDRNERETSYKQVHDKVDRSQPPTPEKTSRCSNSHEHDIYGPRARVEALIGKQKQMRPRARRQKNKEQDPLVNSLPRALVRYGDPMEEIGQGLGNLDINGGDGVVFIIQPQNALVPYAGGSGTMVLFNGNLIKKRKPRPKVDLDPESDRVWRLLMGKESSVGEEGTNMDKEKWWENERRIFHGRADSFIARMHLIQGDRRFSKWKGSVVDSVIGVFLTQNVSDHLSSSAFMYLAARFPRLKDNNNNTANVEIISRSTAVNGEVSEQKRCGQSSSGTKEPEQMHNKELSNSTESLESNNLGCSIGRGLGHESPDSVLGSVVTFTAVEGDDRNSSDDVVSSQNSLASSQNSSEYPDQTSEQLKPIPVMNSEGDELLTIGRGSGVSSFRELLDMADGKVLNDLKATGNESILSATHKSLIDWSASIRIDKSPPVTNGPYLHGSSSCTDTSNSLFHSSEHDFLSLFGAPSSYGYQNFSSSSLRTEISDVFINEYSQSYLPPASFELNQRIINESMSRQYATYTGSSTNANVASRADSFGGMRPLQNEIHCCCQNEFSSKTNISHLCLNQQEENELVFQQRERQAEVHMARPQKAVETRQSSSNLNNDNQGTNLGAGGVAESNLRKDTSQKVSSGTMNNESKIKKGKIEIDKRTDDWDNLRKEAENDGAKKERSNDTMDSLDYEALRNADVGEISNTIRERGMNNKLAERIKDFLNRLVRDHGSIDLEWLRYVPPEKAKDYLLSINGLGLKSVECVRLLTLHHLAFPVDTNVGRIAVRLGWVPLQPLPESLQLHLLEMYPILETIQKYLWPRLCKLDQRTLYELHYQLITFGKVFCTKSKPNCNACPMRGECKHFASAFASARLALPGPEEKRLVSSTIPVSSTTTDGSVPIPMPLPQLDGSTHLREQTAPKICEPIVEEPGTPEPEHIETTEIDIEDAFDNDPDGIPTIKLNLEEFTQNLQHYMDSDLSKALVAIIPEAASIPMPKLKNVNRLRTEHLVYELPDSHPLLDGLDKREADDPCPYLLAIWTPGETAQSIEPPSACCNTKNTGKLCDRNTCFSCNSIREAQAQTVRGTLLIPCRTANRGSFPLNGTYFQVNEVFADHDSSRNPIDVPRDWIWNLPRRTVYFGTSIPTIFKGLTTEGIQQCFWRGFVCVRGFDRTARAPRPLFARLHCPASKVTKNKAAAAAANEKT
ncbi:uncharacterized protein A4U43_C04F660 [Asparagus officinalis]|uniref:HhH-GPD domain-containing protein n=1 Tax=Asparagus officinalis TaxID=4686 RepID=A0A5P1EXX0_ASPOF|nr:protein ROS1-like [Asparagus officinalis]ONK70704.1 uncharacterized protein A4U43_C04F660 [Asparagus officinalis]